MTDGGRLEGRVRKTSKEEIGKDTCCGALYGRLGARKFKFEVAQFDCRHRMHAHFHVMARVLLNGDLSFLALCDFNGYVWQNSHAPQPLGMSLTTRFSGTARTDRC